MGTNYYIRYAWCDGCGRYESLHVGKSGTMVQAFKKAWPDEDWEDGEEPFKTFGEITSWRDWKRIFRLPGVTVWDEYGRLLTADEIERIFESSSPEQRGRQHHATREYPHYAENSWLDEDGFSVALGDWS